MEIFCSVFEARTLQQKQKIEFSYLYLLLSPLVGQVFYLNIF
jgi:hypothetical protein